MAIEEKIHFIRNVGGLAKSGRVWQLALLKKPPMFDMFTAWQEVTAKLERGEMMKEEYDAFRYTYPSNIATLNKTE